MKYTKKGVIGKIVTIGYIDTTETVTGLCFKSRYSRDLHIVDKEGNEHTMDSLEQIKKVKNIKW